MDDGGRGADGEEVAAGLERHDVWEVLKAGCLSPRDLSFSQRFAE